MLAHGSGAVVSAFGAQPGSDVGVHGGHGVAQVCETVGKPSVEAPVAIAIPTVVPYEGFGRHAINIEEFGLPLCEHVEALCLGHAARIVVEVGLIVVGAVNVEFVPRIIEREGAPWYCPLAFDVCQHGASGLILLLVLSNESHHGRYAPCFATLQGGGALPESFNGCGRCGVLLGGKGGHLRSAEPYVSLAVHRLLGEYFYDVAQGVAAGFGHAEGVDVVFGAAAGKSGVVVFGHHLAVFQQVYAHNAQAL